MNLQHYPSHAASEREATNSIRYMDQPESLSDPIKTFQKSIVLSKRTMLT